MKSPATHLPLKDCLRAMRPNQWTKNMLLLAAFFFAYFDRARENPLTLKDLIYVIPAVLLFSLVSSAIYILNDIRDIENDRNHPLKRLRPIAAGRISVAQGCVLSASLLAIGLLGSGLLSHRFLGVVVAYALMQIVYSFGLKRIALADIMTIAAGFVLRAIAGAVALPDVTISPWLLLCTFLLALFLALCKRRHEKLVVKDGNNLQRPSLDKYDARLLDQLIAATSSAVIVAYSIYTLWPDTVEKFDTSALGLTIPFVVFGIFRYLDLVYRHEQGDRPEKILLTDAPILVNLGLYALAVITIIKLHI